MAASNTARHHYIGSYILRIDVLVIEIKRQLSFGARI